MNVSGNVTDDRSNGISVLDNGTNNKSTVISLSGNATDDH